MIPSRLLVLVVASSCAALAARGQTPDACSGLTALKIDSVEITKAELVPAGRTIPPLYPGAPSIGPLPAHCRVDGVINRREGIGGQEFGIGFAIALPDRTAWNGDFM